jgi:hypothetical protein
MSLDKLWSAVKSLKYPIKNAALLEKVLGNIQVEFDGEVLNARDVSLEINAYPVKSAPDLIRDFLKEEDGLNVEEAAAVEEMMDESDKQKKKKK